MAKPPKKKYVSKTQGTRLDDGTYVTPIAEVKGYKTSANAVREGTGNFAKSLFSGTNLATEIMGAPLAVALETLSGRNDYKSALPNLDRSNKMFGLAYDKNNLPQNEQLSPSTALGITNPFISVPIDLAADLVTGKLATSSKSIGKNLVRNKMPKQLQFANQANLLNLFKLNKPKQTFKSEIDWAKWNSDTPKYPELINEYNTIEESTKKAGTWMKNPDGSPFQGTPEQFIQQQSSWFKKAFPNPVKNELENNLINYHGTGSNFNVFKSNVNSIRGTARGSGIYSTPEKEVALEYAKSRNKENPIVMRLYQNSNNPQTKIDDITKLSESNFKEFLKKNPKGSADFKEKFNEFLKKDEELKNNIKDEDFMLQYPFDYLKVGKEQIVPFSNYPKSAVGNVGFFDMTNPNIYKGLIPGAVATGIGTQMLQNNKDIKALGGPIKPIRKKTWNDLNKKGLTLTTLSPNEEATFQNWKKSLPSNLQDESEHYDLRGAWKTGIQPELFYRDEEGKFQSAHPIDVNEPGSIYQPHLFSRDPNTGRYLKGPNHPTQEYAIESDIRSGYTPYIDIKTGDWYSKKMFNGGKITNNMKKKKNNLPKYNPGGTVFPQMNNQNLMNMNVVGGGVSNISNSGGGGFGQQLLGKVGGEIFKNIPGASNIASDPLGSLVGLTTNSVIDMVKAIEEKERERRPMLKNINSVMAMGGKVDDMFNYLYEDILTNNLNSYASGGTIKIKPSKKGTFTKAAKSRGMGVQEFASKVLANKDNYSSAMVKKANFARNASKWKHDMGGYVDPQNVPVEVEGEEMYEMPNGQVGEFSGPKHENGGIPIELPEGTKIYSDRLTINGKTMAERKDKREKNISKLERLLSKNPQDKFIKSALQREKETFQQEEQQDMMVQEQMNNAQQQTEQAMMQMMMPQTTMGYGGMLMANGGYIDPTDPPTNSPTTIKLDPNQAYRVPQLDTEGELTFRNVSYNEKGEPVITDKRIPKYAEYMSPSSHYANQYAEYINQGLYNLKDEERYQRIMQDLTTRYPSQGRDVLFKVADFYNKQGQFSNKKGEFVEGSPVESFGVLNTLYGADAGKYYEQQVANMRKQVEGNLFGKPLKWAPGSINPDNMMIKNETEELANGGMIKRADGSYSKRGLWDNIRANRGSGKKPTKQMLAQEKKIRAEEKAMGGYIYGNGGKLPTEILKARLESHMSSEEANDYLDEYGKGGYVVRKSNDRKGKTHVVIGPDGTKKYFGDPKMGEKGKSKHGKEAFYARHKHNLKNNPYFRAYARATWGMGGTIPTYGNGTPPYGIMTDENYLQRSDEALLKNNFDITNPDNSLMKNIGYPFELNVGQSSLPYNQPLINFDLSKLSSTPYNSPLLENIPVVDYGVLNDVMNYDFSKSKKEESGKEKPDEPLLQNNNFTFSDETYTGLPKMNILGNKPESKEKPGKENKKNKFMEALQKAFLEVTGNKEGFTEGDLKGMQGTEMGKTLPSLMTLLNRLETPKNINFFRNFGQDALRAAQEAQGLASTNKYQQLRDLKLQENAARQRGRGSARGVNTLRALDLASDMLGQQGMEQVYNNYAQQMMSLLGQKSQLENVQDQMVMQGEQNRDLADRQDIDAFYTNLAENMATASEFTQKQGRDLNVKQYNDDVLTLSNSLSKYGVVPVRKNGNFVFEYNGKQLPLNESMNLLEEIKKLEEERQKEKQKGKTKVAETNEDSEEPG